MPRNAGIVAFIAAAILAAGAFADGEPAKPASTQDLHCRVICGLGVPVHDARILVQEPGPAGWVLVAAAKTDRAGDCDLTALPGKSGPWLLEVSADGYHDKTIVSLLEPGLVVPWQTIVLEGARYIAGRVVAAPDTPIPAAQVILESPEGTGQTETDQLGRFGFKDLLPARIRLRVAVPGYGAGTYAFDLSDQIDPVLIVLQPQRQVRIKVVDELDKPVVGVNVQLLAAEPTQYVTDSDGMISIDGAGSGQMRLPVRLQDKFYAFEPQLTWLSVPAGSEPVLLTAKARCGGQITGQVLEAGTDQPIPAAAVWIAVAGEPTLSVSANIEGRFELNAVAKGSYALAATHPVYAADARCATITPGKTTQITLALTLGATVTGLLTDAAGKPVSPGVVRAMLWWPKDRPGLDRAGALPMKLPWRATRTDENGQFRLPRLPAGRLELQGQGQASPARAATTVELEPNQQLGDVKMVLPSD